MNVLVIGASGFIGSSLVGQLSVRNRVLGTFCNRAVRGLVRLDMRNIGEIEDVARSFHPHVILVSAANPNVEYCEEHRDETWETNVKGTENVAKIAQRVEAKLVYFSSDYVFDGKDGPYGEGDTPNPISAYGKQKLASEELVRQMLEDHLVVRTTVVYGWEAEEKNFVMRMIRRLRNGHSMRVPNDQVGTPTYVDNLAAAVTELIEKDKQRTYHIVGPDLLDRYSFAKVVAEVFSLNPELLIPVPTSELGQKARRPLKAGLKTAKAQRELETQLVGVREGLATVKRNLERTSIDV